VFRAALDAVIVMDIDGIVRDFNPAAEETFGYSAEEAIGQELAKLIIPPALRPAHRAGLERYRAGGAAQLVGRRRELTALHRDGSEFAVELAITRIPDMEPATFAGFIRRLDDLEAAKLARLKAEQRATFLAEAGLVLDHSLDLEKTLRGLASLTVPELSHLTVIDLLDPDGTIATAVAAAEVPQHAADMETVRKVHPLERSSRHPVAEVLRTGHSALLPEMSSEFLRTIAQGSEHFELMRRLQYRSAIVVPLVARQRVLGTLSLLRMKPDLPYDSSDLVLAEELARRAAFAVDNARIYESTQRLARTLQASLLPRWLPEIPGVRLTARYAAAQEGQEVGGDFYDVFTIAEDTWGIAIGDVCGKGAEAAALTGLARHTLRAVGGAGATPSMALKLLNDAVIRDAAHAVPRFLTALFALAVREDDRLVLYLAAAGHPPPLVRRADGTIELLQASGQLAGFLPDATFSEVRLELAPGDTLLLYTDGLTDARAPVQMLSEHDLADLLASAGDLQGEALAEHMQAAVTQGEDPRDDIAILLVEVSAVRSPVPDAPAAAAQGSG
jgi:PAS domain S-box-containing protein